MMNSYTKANFDFDSLGWLTSPRKKLGLQAVALGLIHLPPNEGYTFTHSHHEQEEVYIVIRGTGQIQVNAELIELTPGDIVRVSPSARRALKAHSEGMFIICSGAVPTEYPKNPNARYLIDDGIPHYDDVPIWYANDPEVQDRNAYLQARMLKSKSREKS